MRKIVMTPEIIQKVKNLLAQGHNVPQISQLLGINKITISSYLWTHGIKVAPDRGNIHYFDVIDSYAKAYLVGFIAADGALVKANKSGTISLTITLKYEDKDVLEFLKSEIGNTHKLQEIRRPSSFDKTKQIHHIRYVISVKEITQALINLGITPRKSLNMPNLIQNIPKQFRDAFIIGYFDGDGSVSVVNKPRQNDRSYWYESHLLYISIRGTEEFLKGICNHLKLPTKYIKQYDSIPRLDFAKHEYVHRFFQCYNHLPFYYKRKYNIFLSRINHSSYAKYKQGQTISSSQEES